MKTERRAKKTRNEGSRAVELGREAKEENEKVFFHFIDIDEKISGFVFFGFVVRSVIKRGTRGTRVRNQETAEWGKREGKRASGTGRKRGAKRMSSTSRRLRERLLLKLSPPSRCSSSRLLVLIRGLMLLLLLLQGLLLILHRRRRGGVPAAEGDSEAEEDVALGQNLFFFVFVF